MPAAARRFEPTDHPGFIAGPGARKTKINKRAAVRATDQHTCLRPPNTGSHPPSAIREDKVSKSVLIEGQGAARKGDTVGCGASITTGSHNVFIGD